MGQSGEKAALVKSSVNPSTSSGTELRLYSTQFSLAIAR